MGLERASASAATFRAALTPPAQVTSIMGVAMLPSLMSAWNCPRLASVSPPASGAVVDFASSASSPVRSIQTGSSIQSMSSGSSARAIFFAALRLHSPCSSAFSRMLSPCAALILSNGSMPFFRSAVLISMPSAAPAARSIGQIFIECIPISISDEARSSG